MTTTASTSLPSFVDKLDNISQADTSRGIGSSECFNDNDAAATKPSSVLSSHRSISSVVCNSDNYLSSALVVTLQQPINNIADEVSATTTITMLGKRNMGMSPRISESSNSDFSVNHQCANSEFDQSDHMGIMVPGHYSYDFGTVGVLVVDDISSTRKMM